MAWHPFRNVGLKVAALALGTLLWFTVSGQQVERRVAVPVVYRNLPAALEITGDELDVVTVQVRGGDNVISALKPGEDLFLKVDLTDAREGQNVLPLRTDQVTARLGIKVMQVDPGAVTLTLERSGQVDLPIHPTIEGEPAPGFAVGPVTVDPATVTVAGPASRLRDLSSALTERISVDGRKETFTWDATVGVGDSQVRLIEARTARVTVQIQPAPPGERTIEGLLVQMRALGSQLHATADPAQVALVVRGAPAVLNTLDSAQLTPYVDLTGRAPGQYTLPVRIDLPAGLALADLKPGSVSVRIR
jgi:YbbR domain-containing protein